MTRIDATGACADGRSFPEERFEFLEELENWHFWFDGRRRLVLRMLANARLPPAARVVDAGCGTGAMVRVLREKGYRAVGIDPFSASQRERRSASSLVAAGDGRNLPLRDASCAAIVTLDVLEHTDDLSMLREIHRVLEPGGTLILTVPALPSLWSYHDERAGHLRRYTRRTLTDRIQDVGFVIDECQYYQCLLLPLVAATRLAGRSGRAQQRPETPSRIVNVLLQAITRLEVFLGRWIAWPLGSTLALRCSKGPR